MTANTIVESYDSSMFGLLRKDEPEYIYQLVIVL